MAKFQKTVELTGEVIKALQDGSLVLQRGQWVQDEFGRKGLFGGMIGLIVIVYWIEDYSGGLAGARAKMASNKALKKSIDRRVQNKRLELTTKKWNLNKGKDNFRHSEYFFIKGSNLKTTIHCCVSGKPDKYLGYITTDIIKSSHNFVDALLAEIHKRELGGKIGTGKLPEILEREKQLLKRGL